MRPTKSSANRVRGLAPVVMPGSVGTIPRREPVIVPVLEPVMVPTRDPVMVPVLLVREPVIVPPKVIADRESTSTVAIRICPERFMTFSPSELKRLLGKAAGWGTVT